MVTALAAVLLLIFGDNVDIGQEGLESMINEVLAAGAALLGVFMRTQKD